MQKVDSSRAYNTLKCLKIKSESRNIQILGECNQISHMASANNGRPDPHIGENWLMQAINSVDRESERWS